MLQHRAAPLAQRRVADVRRQAEALADRTALSLYPVDARPTAATFAAVVALLGWSLCAVRALQAWRAPGRGAVAQPAT